MLYFVDSLYKCRSNSVPTQSTLNCPGLHFSIRNAKKHYIRGWGWGGRLPLGFIDIHAQPWPHPQVGPMLLFHIEVRSNPSIHICNCTSHIASTHQTCTYHAQPVLYFTRSRSPAAKILRKVLVSFINCHSIALWAKQWK